MKAPLAHVLALIALQLLHRANCQVDDTTGDTCHNGEDEGEGCRGQEEVEDDDVEAKLGPLSDSGLIDETLNGLDQRDPALIRAIRERFLEAPSLKPYNFTKGKENLNLEGACDQ